MSDIFGRTGATVAGVFNSDRARLTLPKNLQVLVQNLSVSYQQPVTTLYEVGQNAPDGGANVYYFSGRPAASISVANILGPTMTMNAFFRQFGNVCNARKNIIQFTLKTEDCVTGSTVSGSSAYVLKNCVLTQTGFSVTSNDMLIAGQSVLRATTLEEG